MDGYPRISIDGQLKRLPGIDPGVLFRLIVQVHLLIIRTAGIIEENEVTPLPEGWIVDELLPAQVHQVSHLQPGLFQGFSLGSRLDRFAQFHVPAGDHVLPGPFMRLQ